MGTSLKRFYTLWWSLPKLTTYGILHMRRAARTDDNQTEIVDALRKAGATVQPLHAVGMGCPDLLVGYRGINYLIEVKDGNKPPSKRKLTDDQVIWHEKWRGKKAIAKTSTEALQIIGALDDRY